MPRVLRLILFFSWLLGCFPVSILCQPRGHVGFKWLSGSVFYTLVVATVGPLLQLDVLYGFGNNDISPNGTASKAFKITVMSWEVTEFINPLAIRITGLVYCVSLVKSIKGTGEVQYFTSRVGSSKLAKLGRWRRRYNLCQTVAYLCLMLSTVVQIRSNLIFFFSFVVPITYKEQLGTLSEAVLPSWKPLILAVSVWSLYNAS